MRRLRLPTVATLGALLLLTVPAMGEALVAVERDVTIAASDTVVAGALVGVGGRARVLIDDDPAPRAPPGERVSLLVDGAPVMTVTTDALGSGSYLAGAALARGAHTVEVSLATRESGAVASRQLRIVAVAPPSAAVAPIVRLGASPSQALVSWEPPLDDGGAPVASYVVEGSAGGAWATVATTASTVRQATHAPPPGETWSYRVAARNFAGRGPWANALGMEPAPGLVANLAASANATAYFLSWTAPTSGGAFAAYVVTRSAEPYGPLSRIVTSPAFVDDVGRRTVAWTYEVRAVSAAAVGPATIVQVEPAKPPTPPTSPIAILGTSPARVHLSWSPPLDDGGAPPERYRVEAGDGVAWSLLAVTPGSLRHVELDAPAGNVSTFRVTAEQYAGRSAPAVFIANATPPGPVEGLVATREGATAHLAWTAPSGGATWKYRVTRTDGQSEATFFVEGLAFSDATDGAPRTYAYSVAAMNALALGPATSTSVVFA